MVDFSRFMTEPTRGLGGSRRRRTIPAVPVAPPPRVETAPVKPPRGDAVKVPVKQPPMPIPPVKPPRAEPVKVPVKQPPMPLPTPLPDPVLTIPAPAPVPNIPLPPPPPPPPVPPVPVPNIPMPMPAPAPSIPAPMPMPAPMPAPVPSVPAPVPPAPIPAPPPPMPVLPAPGRGEPKVLPGQSGPIIAEPNVPPVPPPFVPTPTTIPDVTPPPPPPVAPPPMVENLPPPPDDIVSRGTVGPVAPTTEPMLPPISDPVPMPTPPPTGGIATLPQAPPEPVVTPPVQVPPRRFVDEIPLPDGGRLDLSDVEGGAFTGINLGNLADDAGINIGGTQGPVGGPAPGGDFVPGTGTVPDFVPGMGTTTIPMLPQEAIDEAVGTGVDLGGFNPEDFTTPASEFLTDGQMAEFGDIEPGTPVPTNPTNTGLTPAQQAALDEYLAENPGALDVVMGGGFNPFSGNNTFDSIPSGTTSDNAGSYTVTPVGPVGDLGIGDDSLPPMQGSPMPVNVRSASSFGLTGVQPSFPVGVNPFRRPETQGGIGSLAGGG